MEHVLYINLEHRTDRKKMVESQFNRMGIFSECVNAIACPDGRIGCTLSHIKCLELAKERQWNQVCICEDDILFVKPDLFIDNINKLNHTHFEWDVVMLGGNIGSPNHLKTDYCLRVFNAQTTTGYIVKYAYYDTLIANFKAGLSNLLKTPHLHRCYAIDMYWKILQKNDAWYVLYPLSVVQQAGYSDIEYQHVNYERVMLNIN